MKEQVLAVQRMQDYIKKHLQDDISMADLACASLFSPWHSYRLFKRYTSYTPADYIRRMRLSQSALALRDENCRVIDVAYRLGYNSVDGYQRAFFREFGKNPKEYADKPVPITLFNPFGVISKELGKDEFNMENLQCVFVSRVFKPERKMIVKRGMKAEEYFDYCREVGCDVWNLLLSIKSLEGEPLGLWLPKRYIKPNTSLYVQGVEVALDDDTPLTEGLESFILPAAEYLMFQGEPFKEENYVQAILAVEKAMDRYEPGLVGCVWDDENPRIQLAPVGERGYIELRAVKQADLKE